MTERTLEERVTRLEQLLDRAVAYGRKSAFGRAMLEKLGLNAMHCQWPNCIDDVHQACRLPCDGRP